MMAMRMSLGSVAGRMALVNSQLPTANSQGESFERAEWQATQLAGWFAFHPALSSDSPWKLGVGRWEFRNAGPGPSWTPHAKIPTFSRGRVLTARALNGSRFLRRSHGGALDRLCCRRDRRGDADRGSHRRCTA